MSNAHSYNRLKVNGSLSAITMRPEEMRGQSVRIIILLGMIGAGKSTFIENVSPGKSLDIAGDTLEKSVTHNATLYKIQNLLHWDNQVVIMDTPGFLDPDMSEGRIIAMIQQQLDAIRKAADSVVASILYLHPIDEIRMGRSRWESIRLLRAVSASLGSRTINLITSRWNLVPVGKIGQANKRFESLNLKLFKNAGNMYINVMKFEATLESCLSILEKAWVTWNEDEKLAEIVDVEYKSLVCEALLERIDRAQLDVERLAEDKSHAKATRDHYS